MHKIIRTFLLISALCISTANAAWYEGGTLHKADLGEWVTATKSNKIATTGDFAAGAKLSTDMSELRYWAEDITNCIDEVAADPEMHSQDVAAVAAICIMALKGQ